MYAYEPEGVAIAGGLYTLNSSGGASLSDVVVAVSSGFLTGDVFVGVGRAVRSGVDISVSRRGVVCTLSYAARAAFQQICQCYLITIGHARHLILVCP